MANLDLSHYPEVLGATEIFGSSRKDPKHPPKFGPILPKSRVTVRRWLDSGRFPKPDVSLPSGRRAWKRSTVEAWLEDNLVATA